MKKLTSIVSLILVTGVLAGCTANENNQEPRNELMSTETFVGIISSGDNLSGVTKAPAVGETVYWNPEDKNFSDAGRYSALYKTVKEGESEICYQDSESTGSVTVSTKPNDYNSYFEISTEACSDEVDGLKLKWELDGGGRFDVKVSSDDSNATTEKYVEALQAYVDERAANEPAQPAPVDPGVRPEPIPTDIETPVEED